VGRGIIGGANGGQTSRVGIGSRPWLQKVAALMVAIALTIATADTFKVSAEHYPAGIDGPSMRDLVENSMEIKITRLISDIFVWLAQVQTLIRLFPRHKEKVWIKWIGFALIVLDIIFTCVNNFIGDRDKPSKRFEQAVPTLSYLFELLLSILYAAWVMYYSWRKRRYAFYHPHMKTISLIALLSIIAILTPVVFFVVDITVPLMAGWGNYFRWVGAAAASVIVWEWVERIEILERDERKDGILGRELFDGDELSSINPQGSITYSTKRNDRFHHRRHDTDSDNTSYDRGNKIKTPVSFLKYILTGFQSDKPIKNKHKHTIEKETGSSDRISSETKSTNGVVQSHLPVRPSQVLSLTPPPISISPPDRLYTTSAASTVYVIQHDGSVDPQPVRCRQIESVSTNTPTLNQTGPHNAISKPEISIHNTSAEYTTSSLNWRTVNNPFKRKRTTPPAEIRATLAANHGVEDPGTVPTQDDSASQTRTHGDDNDEDGTIGSPIIISGRGLQLQTKPSWRFSSRLGGLASRASLRPTKWTKRKSNPSKNTDDLPWIVIPALSRDDAWSPGPITTVREESTSDAPTLPTEPMISTGNKTTIGHETFSSATDSTMDGTSVRQRGGVAGHDRIVDQESSSGV